MTCQHGHRVHQCGKCLRREVWPSGMKACRCGLLIAKDWVLCKACLSWESEDYATNGVERRRERREQLVDPVAEAMKVARKVTEPSEPRERDALDELEEAIEKVADRLLIEELSAQGRSERDIADALVYAARQRRVRKINRMVHEAMKEFK